jgi:hypothetical protein
MHGITEIKIANNICENSVIRRMDKNTGGGGAAA